MKTFFETVFRPAILLAFVPLIRWGCETVFTRVFKNSTVEALETAARPENSQSVVRNAVGNEEVRKALAQYIDNASALERFLETCFFSGLSLVVWLISEAEQRWEQILFGALLFAVIA